MVSEHVNFKEEVIVVVGLYFEFIEPVWLPGISTNSTDIELQFDLENTKIITGFTIKTDGSDKKLLKH